MFKITQKHIKNYNLFLNSKGKLASASDKWIKLMQTSPSNETWVKKWQSDTEILPGPALKPYTSGIYKKNKSSQIYK